MKESISLIQQKCYNIFLRNAQREIKFGNKYEEITDKIRYVFEISCQDLEKQAGLNKKDYDYLKQELEKLLSIVISVVNKENKNNWRLFHFLDNIEKKSDVFKYSLDWMIIKALEEQKFFTQLNLLQIAKLHSKYSVILYELARRYENYKIPKMSVEELRKKTNTQNQYNRFYDFRRYVLDKACEEINEKTDIILRYSTEKRGRQIAFVDFEIEKKEIIPAVIEDKSTKVKNYSKEVLELFELLPEKEQTEVYKEEFERLLGKHSLEYLKADIEYAKQVKPANFLGFLKSSCNQGHYATIELEKKKHKEEIAKKRVEETKKQKEFEDRMEKIALQKAVKRYDSLSNKELEKYIAEYERVAQIVPDSLRPTKRDYIIGILADEILKVQLKNKELE